MITYKDCPECGANKIRESVSLCDVCEVSQRYEKRLEQLQALLDLAKTMRDAAATEREEWEATAEKAAAARVERKAVKKRFADLRKELTELKRKLKTEEDFTASYIRRLHESEEKREEWQATAEKAIDASSEGAWMARALDAERELAGLREFVSDEADNDCHYGDNCPSNAGTRHGTCRSCKARQVLSACGIRFS